MAVATHALAMKRANVNQNIAYYIAEAWCNNDVRKKHPMLNTMPKNMPYMNWMIHGLCFLGKEHPH